MLPSVISGVALGFAALMTGCGSGSDNAATASVSGKVTVKGQPKADLTVTFHPEAGGRPATGVTDAEGAFTLSTFNTGDGAVVGTHRASVSAGGGGESASPPMPGFPGYDDWVKKQREAINPKYGDPQKSGLTYTVPAEGLDNVEIVIP